jgi:phage shock protein PspC (stress-responsive transcriptional regulator)/energy-converting hydrogenase Eha subunit C
MEKTIIINIGNTIIHIEESAYEFLKIYLNEVKQHFSSHADDLEIVTDIENRIAELLSEQLELQKKQVVDTATVNLVIGQMGRVNDFDTEEMEEEEPVQNTAYHYQNTEKKLYRDMDDRIIAGVCAGIAHYINLEAKWVRLMMVVIAFAGGAGLLVYIILWFIMPKATSRLEKMEMRGEPANLQGFQKNLDEELQAVRERLSEVNNQAKPVLNQFGNFIAEFLEQLGKFLTGTGKVIFKIIAGIIILFGVLFLIALVILTGVVLGFYDGAQFNELPFSLLEDSYRNEVIFAFFITLFIPILALILFSVRVFFNRQPINKMFTYSLLVVWLCGLAVSGYYIAKISSEFKDHAEISQVTELPLLFSYTLDIDNSKYFTKQDSLQLHINSDYKNQIVLDNDDNKMFGSENRVRISLEKSENGKASLTQTYESHGKIFQQALANARQISYKYKVENERIVFNPKFKINEGVRWRGQEVVLVFKVPVGTKLLVNDLTNRYINNYLPDCDLQEHKSDYGIWVMTEDGLKCKYAIDHPEETEHEH